MKDATQHAGNYMHLLSYLNRIQKRSSNSMLDDWQLPGNNITGRKWQHMLPSIVPQSQLTVLRDKYSLNMASLITSKVSPLTAINGCVKWHGISPLCYQVSSQLQRTPGSNWSRMHEKNCF
ncbi:hypothetical protein AVEN_123624-1 [Araneus ventricosus]|uniref:Uncharacterized protein n=1 Tax=Araneus ventricosus TaxID=182803 RepID=A0A4Y2SM37_ARAVE|nr:hypothetical protein AVEN_123624-1 [Araneus ventricosus]